MKVLLKYALVLFLVIIFGCFIIAQVKDKSQKNVIEFYKEPSFINTSINDALLVIADGKLVMYDSQMNTTNIELDLIITEAYACDDDLWVIDDMANLYTLHIGHDSTYELSDVILENVDYVTGDTNGAIAITTEGEVYVWGEGDEYYSIGLGDNEEVKEPIKVDGISNATEVVRFHVNTAALTESGELYVVGGIINSKWSEEEKEYVVTTDIVKEFTKVQHDSRISHIGELDNLYTVYEDGTIAAWTGIKINSNGDIVLDSETCDWNSDLKFTQISFGESFAIANDSNNDIYFWGYDFTKSMSDKSDYMIHTIPQLIEFDKAVETVYAGNNVAFLKNGLEIYIIP
ncbi:MAG: hypothetical protein E7257_08350 [Lachnospiraceae bacterium]|nr:hypothetical protein [Lachnospiraceae bacterium]